MDSWQPTASTATPPQRQEGQIAAGRPLGGTQAFCCGISRCLRLYGKQLIVNLPMNPSVYVPLIRGPFPRAFLVLPSLSRSAISANHGSFSLFLSPSYTSCLGAHEYSKRRQMSQIHHLRDAALMEKKSRHVRVGDVSRLELSERLCVCASVCVCHCMPAFNCACTCVSVSLLSVAPVCVCARACVCVCTRAPTCAWVSASLLCAYACVEVTAGQHIVPQMFDILCIRGWLEREDKHVPDRGISPPQSATSAM